MGTVSRTRNRGGPDACLLKRRWLADGKDILSKAIVPCEPHIIYMIPASWNYL